jgi:hypothetical protein
VNAELVVLEAVVIRPGDTLIFRCSQPLTRQTAYMIRERARELLPELGDVVLVDNCDQIAVFRPGETRET